MTGSVTVVAGPSGVGKGTLIRRILATDPDLWLSVSATTRAPRPGEVDGVDYVFLSAERFNELRDTGGFLEWAQFAGNCYGTPAAPVMDRIDRGVDVILEIDLQGVRQVRANLPTARTVFISPPTIDALGSRLASRGTEDVAAIERRLAAAHDELAAAGEFDCVIVNDDVELAADQLLAWIHNPAN